MSKKFKPKVKVKKKEEDNFDFMKTTKDNNIQKAVDKWKRYRRLSGNQNFI